MSSYQYNGLGDRLQQTLNGNTTTFTMDLNPSTSLRAGSGLTQAVSDGTNTYLYGLDRIAQVDSGTLVTDYFLTDALGSVRQLTEAGGAVTYASAYHFFARNPCRGNGLNDGISTSSTYQFVQSPKSPVSPRSVQFSTPPILFSPPTHP